MRGMAQLAWCAASLSCLQVAGPASVPVPYWVGPAADPGLQYIPHRKLCGICWTWQLTHILAAAEAQLLYVLGIPPRFG